MFKLMFTGFVALTSCTANNTSIANTVSKSDIQLPNEQASLLLANQATADSIELRSVQDSHYQDLTIRLKAIEDSRCAIGVSCIWAGQLIVTLEVSNDLNDTVQISLVRKRETTTAFAFGYGFRLLNVEPHPKKERAIQLNDQVVHIEIIPTYLD